MAKTNPVEFAREVREEARKITWPTRKELTVSTTMVFIFVIIASLFFVVILSLPCYDDMSEDASQEDCLVCSHQASS